jgi:DNA-binding SARP family transcriptional activator
MANLQLRLLGDLEIVRDGVAQPLPPSKKTRALLAWLALNPRPHRRERLCELLWHVPDDPRGSLRWSLSKLRRLVDDDAVRIVADRNHVAFDPTGVEIDVNALLALTARLDETPLAELEAAASVLRGNLLEGLELANLHDFHTWCMAAREEASQARARLLAALAARLAATPERAVPWARELVGLVPYDEEPRAGLIRLLVAAGRPDEAEQQYRLGLRMLEGVRTTSTGALYRAWRGDPGATPLPRVASPPRTAPIAPGGLVGRRGELERIDALLTDVATNRQARVLLVRGDPGIARPG